MLREEIMEDRLSKYLDKTELLVIKSLRTKTRSFSPT